MASWGAWAPNATTNKRIALGFDFWYTGDPASGVVTVHKVVYAVCRYRIEDYYNRLIVSGHGGAYNDDVAANFPSNDSVITLWSGSAAVGLQYGAETYVSAGASLSGIDYIGASVVASHSVGLWLPAIPYSLPAAPTIGANTRNSDTQNTVSWTNNVSTPAPYANVYVERRDDGGAWVQVAQLVGTATSYVDTTTSANHAYAYRVRGANSAGFSAYSAASATTYNTPAAPTNCVAVKTGATEVTVSCTDASNTEDGFTWERTTDGGANWASAGTTAAGVTTFVDDEAPGGTVAYRVKATRGGLESGYSNTSNSVATLTPPAAPSLLPWPSYSALDVPRRLDWTHNALDGSAQSEAEVVYAYDVMGGTETTVTLVGDQAFFEVPTAGFEAGTELTAKVRTKGLHADYGPFSPLNSTVLASSPQANVTSPTSDGVVIEALPLEVEWGYTDPFTQVKYTLSLYKGGTLVKTWQGTTGTSVTIHAEHLEDDTDYVLVLTVRSAAGFETTVNRAFSTNYLAPSRPSVFIGWDADTLSASVVGFPPETPAAWQADNEYTAGTFIAEDGNLYECTTAGTSGLVEPTWPEEGTVEDNEVVWTFVSSIPPEIDHYVLLRVDTNDGIAETEVLADPYTIGSTVIDRTPCLGVNVTYKLLAVAESGAYSTSLREVFTDPRGYFGVNFGDGNGELLRLKWDPKRQVSADDDSEILMFAGRELPVAFSGEHTTEQVSFKAVSINESDVAVFARLKKWRRATVWRDIRGQRRRVKWESLDDGFDHKRTQRSYSLAGKVVE